MDAKTTRVKRTSQVQTEARPRPARRVFNLTPLGLEACAWIEEQDRQALPMDTLPHREIKKL